MRFFAMCILIAAAVTCSPNTCRGGPSYIDLEVATAPARVSFGAGYERYNADWTGDTWGIGLGRVEQNRYYVRAGYLLGRHLLVTGSLGVADSDTHQIEADQEFGALIALRLTPWGASALEFEVLTPPVTRFSLTLITPLCR